MKSLIIYESRHHGNTEKVARAMAEALGAELKKPTQVEFNACTDYDLVGFGSGIYFSRHDKSIFRLIEECVRSASGKKAFIFATSGMPERRHLNDFSRPLRELLESKGFEVVGVFSCRGHATWGYFGLFGGANKGRPDANDFGDARKFALSLAGKP